MTLTLELPVPPAPEPPPVLELRGIKAAYEQVEVLHGVDLAVPAGKVVAVLGPNGAGKTTMLKVASGMHPPTGG
ncbi:MAG: ATP-binding cassette domain-containing protein, partial [Streptomycetaceae bacterium]|nr:ATP-binding cassette domain-containing protein [Streptomycetaceae bacterium]